MPLGTQLCIKSTTNYLADTFKFIDFLEEKEGCGWDHTAYE